MRLRNRLALVGAGGIVLVVTAYATVTRTSAVEARVRALLASELRAPCTFESAEFSFLDGLALRGLRVLDPEDPLRPPLIDVGEARVDFHLDLLGSGPRLTVVHLVQPTVRIAADRAGRPSLLGIVPPPQAGAPAVTLPVVRITDGTVILDGPPALGAGDRATLTSIRADVLAADGRLRVPDGHARAESLGAVAFSLDVAQEAGTVDVSLRAQDLDVTRFARESSLSAVTGPLRDHSVTGAVAVEASMRLTGGQVTDLVVDLRLAGIGAEVSVPEHEDLPPTEPFRIELETAHVRLADGRAELSEARGRALGAPLEIAGHADVGALLGLRTRGDPEIDLTVTLRDARVGPEVAGHFPAHLREIREAFSLEGRTDARVLVRGPLEDSRVDAVLDVLDLRAGYAGYADEATGERRGFPWYADGLSGRVSVIGPRVELEARGRHGPATVAVQGFHERTPEGAPRTEVRVTAEHVPLDADLRAGFGDRAEAVLGPWDPGGTARRVEVLIEEVPDVAGGEDGVHVTVELDGHATFTPDALPAPLRDVRGTVRILEPEEGGRRVSRVELAGIRAVGDGFEVRSLDGVVGDDDEELTLALDVARLDGPFADAVLASTTLSEGVKRSLRLLRPRGAAVFDARIVTHDGVRDDVVTATLEGVAVDGWEGVPLPAEGLAGTVRYEDGGLATDGLTGTVLGGAAIRVVGTLTELEAPAPVAHLDVAATGLPLGVRLRDALGTLAEPAHAVWEELPAGDDLRADVTASIRPPGDPAGELVFALEGVRGSVAVLGLALDLTAGRVAYAGDLVTGELTARRGAGELAVADFRYRTGSGDLDARLSARGLAFPDDLVPLLSPEAAANLSETLAPSVLHVPHLDLAWEAGAQRLTAQGAAALRVTAAGSALPGLHVRSTIEIDEAVVVLPEDGPAAVSGRARLSETSLDPGVALKELAGPLVFRGALGAAPSTFEADLAAGQGRVEGLLLADLHLRLEVAGDVLRIPRVSADLYGGRLEGQFRRGGERLAYRGGFTVRGTDLAAYARDQQREEMSGALDADVRFRAPLGGGPLEGSGEATLSGAEIRVPWVSAALRAVDGALLGVASIQGSFHAGRLAFDLRGQRALIRELHLEGPSVPLLFGATLELQDGRGAIDLVDGRLDMIVYPRLRFGVLGLDPTGIFDRIVGVAQFLVRRLRIEGSTRNPRTTWEVLDRDLEDEFARRPRPLGEVRRYGPEPW